VEEVSGAPGALAGEFGGTAGGAHDEEAQSRMGPVRKPNELSESANPSSWEAGGEEEARGSCSDCEECEGDDPGEEPGEGAVPERGPTEARVVARASLSLACLFVSAF
jgi:hypothetical protein